MVKKYILIALTATAFTNGLKAMYSWSKTPTNSASDYPSSGYSADTSYPINKDLTMDVHTSRTPRAPESWVGRMFYTYDPLQQAKRQQYWANENQWWANRQVEKRRRYNELNGWNIDELKKAEQELQKAKAKVQYLQNLNRQLRREGLADSPYAINPFE